MSGGGSQNSTVKTEPPSWAVPYLQNYMQKGADVANQPYKPYTGQTVAQLNPTQYGALDAITKRAQQGTPEQSAGRQELTGTLAGRYLGHQTAKNPYAGSNPYLTQQIDQAQGDVVRNYNNVTAPAYGGANAKSGSFGNAGLAEMENASRRDLMGQLGNISSGMRFNDYTTQQGLAESDLNRQQSGYEGERNRMLAALGQVPGFANMDYTDAQALLGVGNTLQDQNQRNLNDQYNRFNEAQNYPAKQLGILGSVFGNQSVGSSTTQQLPSANRGAGALGGALGGAQLGSMIFPGMGTGIGAGLGGLLGLFGGG